MPISLMRFLLLSSLFLMCSCKSIYSGFQSTTGDLNVLNQFKPQFETVLYKTQVDVLKHHLSGLLLIKTMPDSSVRMVFSNETGLKFFDFSFDKGGGFKVFYILKQMNKKAVVTTLQKDLELILMRHLEDTELQVKRNENQIYYVFPKRKGFESYVVNPESRETIKIIKSSKTKPVVEIVMKNYIDFVPDTIGITHKNFHFIISLKKLEKNVAG